MHLDVRDLRAFYFRSSLGRSVQKVFAREMRALWPDCSGQTMVGYGFATPLLRPFVEDARRVVALMPAPQGVMPWPAGKPNLSVLCEEHGWPLQTGAVDRLALLHGLETSQHPEAVLEECWRVLGPGGRAVIVVPNRTGLWARRDRTPFGHGRPYSTSQLEGQLRDHGFRVEQTLSTLFQPPSDNPLWRRSAQVMESAGRHIPVFKAGGVLMIEVCKQVPRPARPDGIAQRVGRPLRVLEGVTATEGASRGQCDAAADS